jgi:predicted TIM-barrel fold metal-dependent hydrolase
MSIDQKIDSHVHLWSSDRVKYPNAPSHATSERARDGFEWEEFSAVAMPFGVNRVVLVQMDFYGVDNSYLLETVRRLPGICSGIAQVDEYRRDLFEELMRLWSGGIRGVRVTAPGNGDRNWAESRCMHHLWRCCAELRIAICPLITADEIQAISRMCQRHPETTVVIDHAANIGSDGTFPAIEVKALCELAQWPAAYVKTSAYYYVGLKQPPYDETVPLVRELVSAFGPERLMWGSDCPFQLDEPNTYEASLEFVNRRLDFLSEHDRKWLLQCTAERVFFQ